MMVVGDEMDLDDRSYGKQVRSDLRKSTPALGESKSRIKLSCQLCVASSECQMLLRFS